MYNDEDGYMTIEGKRNAVKIELRHDGDEWEGEYGRRVCKVVFTVKEWRFFSTQVTYMWKCLQMMGKFDGMQMKRVHAGGDHFIDFVTLASEPLAILYKGMLDPDSGKIFRDPSSTVQLTGNMFKFVCEQIKEILGEPGVTTIKEVGLCLHENQLGLFFCRVCRPLGKRNRFDI